MVTYILDGKSTAQLPRRPLVVAMSVMGRAGVATLEARRDGAIDPTVIIHSAEMLILPLVERETLLVAVPSGGAATFPAGTTVHVSVAVDSSRDPDPDRAQLTPRDVSGLSYIELATVAPDGDHIVVATRLEVAEIELGALASRARIAARSVLGVDQAASGQQRLVDIRVDTSASMLPSVSDGTVRAIIDILAGISTVISPERSPVVSIVGSRSTPVALVDADQLAGAVHAQLLSAQFGVGFGARGTFDGVQPESLVVLVTDSVAAVQLSPERVECVAVVASPSRGALAGAPGAVVTPAPDGSDTSQYLLDNPLEIDEVVRGILGGRRGGVW